ncbi:DNA polymerase III subunit delta [Carboxylicivirga caseinilyticus]|uniref:DNA polymerase III subunit delta n=1 Tax=Carboxylicivirga caseinilyticus TaxID=3417572 RepID=UPI003D343785|nr:DNA polymerase III subunit delta [Marinilabiliaceae bacterium A049]
MTFEQILKDLKQKQYKPIYFLMGNEGYFIDQITNYIANNVLTEEEKGFNQTILYGKDVEAEDIIMAARRFPMMSQHQVIIVKEAQNIAKIEDLVIYADNPLNSTILVINYRYKTLDKRKKLYKSIQKNGVLFESSALREYEIPKWVSSYLQNKGKTIDAKASALLAEFLGTDLSKITHELDKLELAIGSSVKQIDSSHIEKNIGVSKDYNNFELQKAVLYRDIAKANKIVLAFGKNPKAYPIQVTIVTLFGAFLKLLSFYYLPDKSKNSVAAALKINPFFVQDYMAGAKNYPARKVIQIISLLREYDMKSKGFDSATTDPGELLKELIFKIMH